MGKEILTLQFGQKANYLATHFWNSQVCFSITLTDVQEANFVYGDSTEELIIDNDVHFRAGIGQGGIETYTPRTLIYDLKGTLLLLLSLSKADLEVCASIMSSMKP